MRKTFSLGRFLTTIMTFLLVALAVPSNIFADTSLPQGLFSGKYGKAQIFDVQRQPVYPVENTTFTLSGFDNIYDASNYDISHTGTQISWGSNNDRYVQFIDSKPQKSTKNPTAYTVSLNLYEKDGTLVKTISNYGTVWGLGPEGFFYEGHDHYGYFVSNKEGFAYGATMTYTPTVGIVYSVADLNNYGATKEVLVEGEKAKPVTGITVNGSNNATSITENGGALQMNAVVTPDDAGNKDVIWTVVNADTNSTANASISDSGVLLALQNGKVTVNATAKDGSKVVGSKEITISGQGIRNAFIANGSHINGISQVLDDRKVTKKIVILKQVAVSILTQANQLPPSILELLK